MLPQSSLDIEVVGIELLLMSIGIEMVLDSLDDLTGSLSSRRISVACYPIHPPGLPSEILIELLAIGYSPNIVAPAFF